MKLFNFSKIAFVLICAFQIGGAAILIGAPTPVFAAEKTFEALEFTPQVKLPNTDFDVTSLPTGSYNPQTGAMTSDLLAKYIQAFYSYGLAVVGILAAIILMAGGVLWLTSAGNDSKIAQAKELITGSIVGSIILFGSWIILNTVNPNLLKLKTIDTTLIEKTPLDSCCEYDSLTAKQTVSKYECEKAKGKYYERAKLTTNTGGQSFCADSGCCRCKIGGTFSTLFISNTNCADENDGKGKVLPETCEAACATAGKISGNLKWETLYVWGQVCDVNGECAPSAGGKNSGGGGEF